MRRRHAFLYSQLSTIVPLNHSKGIAATFLETAEHEKMHAKRYFELLEGMDVEITAGYPTKIGGTEAPERCPTCAHPQGWFIPVEANY
ncbi:ferritin family protein [Candidatus Deferrimicrobium sp.]|uniref:ferritin family protein n=1 Tax=Candidatus Deferrimicrobium sp. TaxID=3060586 RepID=UPI003C45A6BA